MAPKSNHLGGASPRTRAPAEAPPGEAADRRQSVQSIDIGLRILDILAARPAAMALKDIAHEAQMPPSQAHRYLRSFIKGEMVTQHPLSGHYLLGRMALRVGLAALQGLDGLAAATQRLKELVTKWDHTGGIAVWGERGPVMVRWYQGQSFLISPVALGTVFPLLGSAVGRVFLAHLPRHRTAQVLRREKRRPASDFADITTDQVEAIRDQVRHDGYSEIVDHFTPRIRGLAVPVFDLQGEPQIVMTIAGRLPENRAKDVVLDELRLAAQEVSAALGHQPQA